MRQLSTTILACGAVAIVLGAVAACNSSVVSGGSFGGGSTSGVGSAGSAGPPSSVGPPTSPDCEVVTPVNGFPCVPGVCEYGGSPDPACNTIATCRDTGWEVVEPTHCPKCPTRFDQRAPGTACGEPDVCTYLEATCGCAGAIVLPSTTDPDAGDGGGDDSGDAGGANAAPPPIGSWQCVRPGNGCPARRPVPGAICNKAMTCDYGTCVFGVPLTLECTGTWAAVQGPACP